MECRIAANLLACSHSGGAGLTAYNLNVNGKILSVDVSADTPLLWVLRDTLELTGTKFGCGQAFCGACTVHIDGSAERSCSTRISTVGDSKIRTIEGLSADGSHPLQKAWLEVQVAQCGYCQAGMIMSCAVLLEKTPNPTDGDIDDALAGHICRCGTYLRIRRAVHAAAKMAAELRRDAGGGSGGVAKLGETISTAGVVARGERCGTCELAGAASSASTDGNSSAVARDRVCDVLATESFALSGGAL
jgi:isoquinoline 1-oxidoreductase subunit alpha